MRSAVAIILSAFATQARATEPLAKPSTSSQESIDSLLDKIFDRALGEWPSRGSDLQNTTLVKALPSQLAQPRAPATALRSAVVPSIARTTALLGCQGCQGCPGCQQSARMPNDRLSHISHAYNVHASTISESRGTLQSPTREMDGKHSLSPASHAPDVLKMISEDSLLMMEKEELLNGQAVRALRRFSDAMEVLPQSGWESLMKPAFAEMAYNLESFNPVFTACLLQVQMTVGLSDYERRDQCLQRLIQPLAGEYGLHAGEPLGKTHRALFREWFESTMGGESLDELMRDSKCSTPKAKWLFQRMISDVETAGTGQPHPSDSTSRMEKACYALGYNLAVEYLANPEKTWLLESFEKFDKRVLKPLGRQPEYEFLVVHAIGEKEHAHLGHEATTLFVPKSFQGTVRRAMRDHDRDLAAYYNHLADILEGRNSAQC